MVKAIAAALLAVSSLASAVPFRLASFNVGALYLSASPEYGLGAPGTQDYEKVREVLGRINADVVALEEIHNIDIGDETAGTPEAVASLAASLGYGYIYIPQRTSLDSTLRVIILSKYPFLTTDSIGSPGDAKDVTRRLPAVRVDIPGTTRDPLIIAGHLKSATAASDRFRRAVELKRVADYLTAKNITAADNFIITGDFNLSSTDTIFTTAPSGFPPSFVLGTDITYPFTYSTNPVTYFPSPTVSRVDLRQTNGSTTTFPVSESAIDVMLVSPAITNRPLTSEVYNSALDATTNGAGLPKAGAPLASDSSALASDHLAVFADIELDVNFPQIALALTAPVVTESSAGGAAKLLVTLPAAPTADVTLTLSSSDPAVAQPAAATVIIPAGLTSTTVDILTTRNFLADGDHTITFSATASRYVAGSAALQVLESDAPYRFTAAGQTITENFTGFSGNHDPAPWTTSSTLPWTGLDPGSSKTPGFHAYGSGSASSLGFLADASVTTPSSFSATFTNQSSTVLNSLEISLTAKQFRAALGGTADRLTAEIITASGTIPVPSLTFTAATNLPSGAIFPPTETPLTAMLDGLAIPAGESFQLRFTVTPGNAPATLPAGVFINEFHYDNAGTDEGEFVEIAVGPGFTGNLSEISLVLYNGGTAIPSVSGVTYGTHLLSTFTAGAVTPSGHRLFSKLIPSIQNGPSDGFALVRGGSQVLQFISYGGTMPATAGPASGMTSTDVGVSQPGTVAAGFGSIRLTGTGSSAADFTWTTTPEIAHSAGSTNAGQTLTARPPGQGIAIDDLRVKFLDSNLDSDGDGFTDSAEINLLLTNPNDANSRFIVTLQQPTTDTIRLSFPTLTGRNYLIEKSTDLAIWTNGPVFSGDGNLRAADFPIIISELKYFYRVRVSLAE